MSDYSPVRHSDAPSSSASSRDPYARKQRIWDERPTETPAEPPAYTDLPFAPSAPPRKEDSASEDAASRRIKQLERQMEFFVGRVDSQQRQIDRLREERNERRDEINFIRHMWVKLQSEVGEMTVKVQKSTNEALETATQANDIAVKTAADVEANSASIDASRSLILSVVDRQLRDAQADHAVQMQQMIHSHSAEVAQQTHHALTVAESRHINIVARINQLQEQIAEWTTNERSHNRARIESLSQQLTEATRVLLLVSRVTCVKHPADVIAHDRRLHRKYVGFPRLVNENSPHICIDTSIFSGFKTTASLPPANCPTYSPTHP